MDSHSTAVKIIMTWNIKPESEQDYFEFVIRDLIPGIQRSGAELSDAWATVYGAGPQITVGALLPSLNRARQFLSSAEWNTLYDRLMGFVQDFNMKIIEARGGFQL
jgi:hypothetical protein